MSILQHNFVVHDLLLQSPPWKSPRITIWFAWSAEGVSWWGGGFISGEGFPPTPTRRSSEKLWTKVPRKRPQQYSLREAIRTLEVLAVEGRALGKVFRWTPPTSKVWADATPGVSFAPPVACFLDDHCF